MELVRLISPSGVHVSVSPERADELLATGFARRVTESREVPELATARRKRRATPKAGDS